jgi:signal transduction histidine kinase
MVKEFSLKTFQTELKSIRKFLSNYPITGSFDRVFFDFLSKWQSVPEIEIQFLLIDRKECWQYYKNKSLITPAYSGFYNHLKNIQNTSFFKSSAYRTVDSIAELFPHPEFITGYPFNLISGKRIWVLINSQVKEIFHDSVITKFQALIEKFASVVDLLDYSEVQKTAEKFKAQEEAVATLVHQLKSPLVVLERALQLAIKQPNSAEKYLTECREKLNKTQAMISAYLDLMKIKEIQLMPFSIHDTLGEVTNFFRYSLEELNINLNIECHLSVEENKILGHQFLAFQVFQNLIENACKAIGKNGDISIEVNSADSSGESFVEIRVTDNGPGVSAEVLDKIFEPFVSEFKSGHGFGLSICKRIMTLFGGDIQYICSSGSERGCFLLTFRRY